MKFQIFDHEYIRKFKFHLSYNNGIYIENSNFKMNFGSDFADITMRITCGQWFLVLEDSGKKWLVNCNYENQIKYYESFDN